MDYVFADPPRYLTIADQAKCIGLTLRQVQSVRSICKPAPAQTRRTFNGEARTVYELESVIDFFERICPAKMNEAAKIALRQTSQIPDYF